eukprot:1004551-Prymnesium_polylepis.1
MVKAGVELAFDAMVDVGMKPESAYYESLHETPLIANTVRARPWSHPRRLRRARGGAAPTPAKGVTWSHPQRLCGRPGRTRAGRLAP